jgi:ankyrin repeat protein
LSLQFIVYNAVLRRAPDALFGVYKAAGNFFSTAIHVLQSAVVKIAQHTRIPDGIVLYRGLSAKLPPHFQKANEQGCKGYAEWGFLSTTANREVAVMYSGVKKGQPTATVLQMRANAVNRPACIEAFSQYPHEREYLWVPLSYMQPDGTPMVVATPHGVLQTVDVAVCANGTAATTEELLGRKRRLHLKAFECLVAQLRADMLHEAGRARVARAKAGRTVAERSWANKAIEQVMKDMEAVLGRHRAAGEEEYTSADGFRGLNEDMVDACAFGLSKFRFWLEQCPDDAAACLSWSPRNCHRLLVTTRRKRLEGLTGFERAAACADVLRLMGVVRRHVGELNEVGETLLTQSAAEDRSPNCLRLLIQARCRADCATAEGVTALYRAAQCGNVGCVEALLEALLEASGSVDPQHGNGATPLYMAAQNGHAPCVRALLAARAFVDAVSSAGTTPVYIAAQGGHAACVEELLRARADANIPSNKGVTAVYYAARCGWTECVRLLVVAGADLSVRYRGMTALERATAEGHADCVAVLSGCMRVGEAAGGAVTARPAEEPTSPPSQPRASHEGRAGQAVAAGQLASGSGGSGRRLRDVAQAAQGVQARAEGGREKSNRRRRRGVAGGGETLGYGGQG